MKIFEVLFRADTKTPYHVPLGSKQTLDINIIIQGNIHIDTPIPINYTGTLEGDMIVLTISLYAGNNRCLQELQKHKGIQFMNLKLHNIDTQKDTTEYTIFRPKRRISGLINENISKTITLGKGESYEITNYITIGLHRNKLSEFDDEIFAITKDTFGIYIKETLYPFLSKFKMFELKPVPVA